MAKTIPDVTHVTEEITPAIAEKYLQQNTRNRPIRQWHVDQLALDMDAGRWKENGVGGVTFDWNNELADGQHTLSAVVQSGVTIRCRVTRGVEPEARSTMNDTVKQKFSDDLHVSGVRNSTHAEPLLRKVMYWEQAEAKHGQGGLGRWRWARFSRSELAEGWARNAEGITTALNAGIPYRETWQATNGNFGALEFMLWLLLAKNQCNPVTVTEFFDRLTMGSMEDDDQILLRLRMKFQKKPNTADYQVYWMITTWNKWTRGVRQTKLQLPTGAERVLPDPFPKIQRAR